jgi:periplasmic divalent cation tolerance protein
VITFVAATEFFCGIPVLLYFQAMKTGRGFLLVLVTAPDARVARRLAKGCCRARLAACVNLVPGIESHYWWEGKLQKGREVLMVIKALSRNMAALERFIKEHHPYETPEIIAIPVTQGTESYLAWWASEASGTP